MIQSFWLFDQALKEGQFGQPPKSKRDGWEAVVPWRISIARGTELALALQKAVPQCLPHTNPGRGAIF